MIVNSNPVVILGSGGHARVLVDALQLRIQVIKGFVAPEITNGGLNGIPWLGDDSAIGSFAPEDVFLVNGIGSITRPDLRRELFEKFKHMGYNFVGVIHPGSVLAHDVVVGEGTQIMAGAVVQCGARLGRNVIINTNASVDHDCCIGDHVHVAPGCTISGGVDVGLGAYIGAGSTVVQGIKIGADAIIGAGALVLNDVESGSTVVGVPARRLKS